jgi:hypothetical protein
MPQGLEDLPLRRRQKMKQPYKPAAVTAGLLAWAWLFRHFQLGWGATTATVLPVSTRSGRTSRQAIVSTWHRMLPQTWKWGQWILETPSS